MGQSNETVKRVDVAEGVSGVDRIKILLLGKGFRTIAAWARARGLNEKAVWHALGGRRRGSATTDTVLNCLAADTGKARAVIDSLIGADDAEGEAA